jgi:esterase/lipase
VTSVNVSRIDEIKVPVYFFLGLNDYSVQYELAERYLSQLKAHYKEIVWLENSGHIDK